MLARHGCRTMLRDEAAKDPRKTSFFRDDWPFQDERILINHQMCAHIYIYICPRHVGSLSCRTDVVELEVSSAAKGAAADSDCTMRPCRLDSNSMVFDYGHWTGFRQFEITGRSHFLRINESRCCSIFSFSLSPFSTKGDKLSKLQAQTPLNFATGLPVFSDTKWKARVPRGMTFQKLHAQA